MHSAKYHRTDRTQQIDEMILRIVFTIAVLATLKDLSQLQVSAKSVGSEIEGETDAKTELESLRNCSSANFANNECLIEEGEAENFSHKK